MIRLAVIAMVIAGLGLSMVGCTNTVRGFGKDVNSNSIQNYNSRTAIDY